MKYLIYVFLASSMLACTGPAPITTNHNQCVTTTGTDSILVDCGSYSYSIPKPKDGEKGDQGEVGPQGQPGVNGEDGQDATLNQYDIVSVLDPCGDTPNVVDEVLLKLRNGQVLASFSANASGANARFSLLAPGNYLTTDGSNCHFTIDANGNMLNEHR